MTWVTGVTGVPGVLVNEFLDETRAMNVGHDAIRHIQ